jgi:acyl carrier protein
LKKNNSMNIQDKLQTIFRNIFNEPNLIVSLDMNANDVDSWDSLSHMEMISQVEEEFGVKFKLKDLVKLKNVSDLIYLIEEKLA